MTGATGISGCLLSQLFTTSALSQADGQGQVQAQSPAAAPCGDQVLVLAGHDRIERVLEKFGVPHTLIRPLQLTDPLLSGASHLFVNCGGALPEGQAHKIAAWVEGGGRLMTTDWMACHLLQTGFRDEKGVPLVRHHNRLSTDESGVFAVTETDWNDPAAGIFLRHGRQWKVVRCSYPVRIEDAEKVHVLARSSHLGALSEGADTLFLRFTYGRGEVLHLTSHWYEQEFEDRHPIDTSIEHRSLTFIRNLN